MNQKEAAQKALTLVCQVCRTSFMSTSDRATLQQHQVCAFVGLFFVVLCFVFLLCVCFCLFCFVCLFVDLFFLFFFFFFQEAKHSKETFEKCFPNFDTE